VYHCHWGSAGKKQLRAGRQKGASSHHLAVGPDLASRVSRGHSTTLHLFPLHLQMFPLFCPNAKSAKSPEITNDWSRLGTCAGSGAPELHFKKLLITS